MPEDPDSGSSAHPEVPEDQYAELSYHTEVPEYKDAESSYYPEVTVLGAIDDENKHKTPWYGSTMDIYVKNIDKNDKNI